MFSAPLFAGIAGAMAVALGAWAAHGAEPRIGAAGAAHLATAAHYTLIHALLLLALAAGGRAGLFGGGALALAQASAIAGILLFGGSLIALALGAPGWLGWLTPLGGLAFILAWLAAGIAAGGAG